MNCRFENVVMVVWFGGMVVSFGGSFSLGLRSGEQPARRCPVGFGCGHPLCEAPLCPLLGHDRRIPRSVAPLEAQGPPPLLAATVSRRRLSARSSGPCGTLTAVAGTGRTLFVVALLPSSVSTILPSWYIRATVWTRLLYCAAVPLWNCLVCCFNFNLTLLPTSIPLFDFTHAWAERSIFLVLAFRIMRSIISSPAPTLLGGALPRAT